MANDEYREPHKELLPGDWVAWGSTGRGKVRRVWMERFIAYKELRQVAEIVSDNGEVFSMRSANLRRIDAPNTEADRGE